MSGKENESLARILVIEDNLENLDLMVYLLRHFGYVPLTAQDGEEGLEIAQREFPDLILCDLQMPKLDGYAVARELRRDPRLAKVPLVAVTAYAMRGDRDKVLGAGFTGYITKPIVPEEFVSQVEAFVPPHQRSLGPPPPSTPGASAGTPVAYRATILVVDNSPVNLSLMRCTLQPFGYRVLTVHSAQEALSSTRTQHPDLIVSDIHMPEEDGYELLKSVRADPQLHAIPFMLISSTVWQESEPTMALALGADRFVLRPIEPQALVHEIEACLEKRKGK